MEAILAQIGSLGLVALAGGVLGVLVLVLALRALGNAALSLRARLFALGSSAALLGVGAGRPMGGDSHLTDTLFEIMTEAVARWLDSPVETAAVIVLLVLVALFCLWLVFLYYWIRTLMRVAWMAFVGLCLLALSITVILAADGVLPVPDLLRNGFVLTAIGSMLLVLWGVVRMLRGPTSKP